VAREFQPPVKARDKRQNFMARRIKNLDAIRVASPCQTDWDAMAGDERVRFCGQCNKSVYNLSALTRKQAATLISDKQGKLCAKFLLRPDGTLLTLEPASAPRAPRGRTSRYAAAAFTAVFSLCTSVFAQSATQAGESPARAAQTDIKRESKPQAGESQKKLATLGGTVYDQQEAVIPQVKVTLINEGTQHESIVETNEEGAFIFDKIEDGLYTLVAVSSGFESFKLSQLKLRAGEEVRLNVTLRAGTVGEIMIIDPPQVENSALNFVIEKLSVPYRGLKKIVKADPR
jgi:hypothetical protein